MQISMTTLVRVEFAANSGWSGTQICVRCPDTPFSPIPALPTVISPSKLGVCQVDTLV